MKEASLAIKEFQKQFTATSEDGKSDDSKKKGSE